MHKATSNEPLRWKLCASGAVVEKGQAQRFWLVRDDGRLPAFVVRYQGQVWAYVNRCAHAVAQLDWNPGDFFDLTGHYLVCSLHGAHYRADTGVCEMGPCPGARLAKIDVVECEGHIWCLQAAEPEVPKNDPPTKELA